MEQLIAVKEVVSVMHAALTSSTTEGENEMRS